MAPRVPEPEHPPPQRFKLSGCGGGFATSPLTDNAQLEPARGLRLGPEPVQPVVSLLQHDLQREVRFIEPRAILIGARSVCGSIESIIDDDSFFWASFIFPEDNFAGLQRRYRQKHSAAHGRDKSVRRRPEVSRVAWRKRAG